MYLCFSNNQNVTGGEVMIKILSKNSSLSTNTDVSNQLPQETPAQQGAL